MYIPFDREAALLQILQNGYKMAFDGCASEIDTTKRAFNKISLEWPLWLNLLKMLAKLPLHSPLLGGRRNIQSEGEIACIFLLRLIFSALCRPNFMVPAEQK